MVKVANPAPQSLAFEHLWARVGDLSLTTEAVQRGLDKATESALEVPQDVLDMLGTRLGRTGDADGGTGLTGLQVQLTESTSKATKAELKRGIEALHREVATEIKTRQKQLGEIEKAKIELQGEVEAPKDLPEDKSSALRAYDQSVAKLSAEKHELGQLGRLLTALRGETFLDKLGIMVHTGVGASISGALFAGGFFIPNVSARDAETGERTKEANFVIGGATPWGGGGKVLGKPGFTRSISVIPYVSAARDVLLGDSVSVTVPGLFYAGMYLRGETAGVQFGFFPKIFQLGTAIEHPILSPIVKPILTPMKKGVDWIEDKVVGKAKAVGGKVAGVWNKLKNGLEGMEQPPASKSSDTDSQGPHDDRLASLGAVSQVH